MDDVSTHTDEWAPVPLDIPPHWVQVDFEDVFENISLVRLKIPQKEYLSSGAIPIVDQSVNLVGGFTNDASKSIQSDCALIVFGDHTKCFKLVGFQFVPGADGVKVLKPIIIDERFAYYACKALRLPDRGYSRHYAFLKKSKIPLAPLNEQHRIVAKIEELFSELDKGVESLEKAREQLKIYRQAVLKHAFEGKLTAKWREENQDKLEKPEQLLARVKREREARYEQQLEEWKTAVKEWEEHGKRSKRPSKPRGVVDLPQLKFDDLAKLPPVPDCHAYTYLAYLGQLGRGKSKHRPRNAPELFGGNYPFIQTGEVKAAGRIIREHTQTYSELGLAQSKLWPQGTLCITIAANIAETAFLGFDCCFPDSVVGFTAVKALVLPEYIELFIKSVRTRIEAYAPATAQKNINLTTLESLVVPLCSLEEQRVLVYQLDAVLSVIENQRSEIYNMLLKATGLRQSILKQAFSGKFVAQDPYDEPVSLLLERIKAEKAAQSQTTINPPIA